jgi:hypothetical protein
VVADVRSQACKERRLHLIAGVRSADLRFCCKSRLREATKRDSVVLRRIASRSIHDGPSEE